MADLPRIPLSAPHLAGREREYLQQCIDDNWVAQNGPFVRRFESAFADLHDRPDAVSTTSGSAALHLALLAHGIGPGDEVIVPSLTFIASANPIRYVGATPVFADVERSTHCIDPASVAKLVGPATKAIVIVHLYGHPARMDELLEIAAEHDLAVIEDATEALGSTYRGQLCGTFGDVGCFSFNGNKLITTGGGGMVLASKQETLDRIQHLTLQGREPSREYIHDVVGFNYTMNNMQAAVGLAQFERFVEFLAKKRAVAERYRAGLALADGVEFFWESEWARSNFWLQTILVEAGKRTAVMDRLDRDGIDSRPFFHPIHRMKPYREFTRGELPCSDWLYARGICIPSSVELQPDEQDRVIAALNSL